MPSVLPAERIFDTQAAAPVALIATHPLTAIPILHSRLASDAKLYLDFDGHFEATWSRFSNITTPPYTEDGDTATFTDSELANIRMVWARVAEDFAPFDIDVTTESPPSFANGVALRIAIGGSSLDWYDPTGTEVFSGYAFIGAFTSSVSNVAYVFPAQLGGGGAEQNIADAASHEAGHSFWLRHQSLYNTEGTKIAEYNPGGAGWAPIMGISYSASLSTWHNGTSTSAATFQDDMAVIASATNGFGYRADDHGGTIAAASPMSIAVGGGLTASGVIERNDDIDAFSFATDAGEISLALAVAPLGANLDAAIELRDAAGQTVATDNPTASLSAAIHATVPAGTYTLLVRGTGEYGRVGQYSISGAVADTASAPIQPPVRLLPLGSAMAVSGDNVAQIASAADSDEFLFFAQAGQTILATATPTDASANLGLELVSPNGTVLAAASGSPAELPPWYIAASGDYRLRLTSDRATAVNLTVGFNLAVETIDTTPGNGQAINNSRITVGSDRYAVLGRFSPTGGGSTTLIDSGTWRYLDDGSNQQTAWRTTTFNDSIWQSGPSQFGYGDGDEGTLLDEVAGGGARIRTFYFRHHFDVADPAAVSALTLNLLRDDGAAIYLNGTEVRRDNLDANAAYDDFATVTVNGGAESTFFPSAVDPALLRAGDNVLAVEVHQRANNSSDVSFDLRLTGTTFAPDVDEYQLDLTGKVGQRLDVILASQGQTLDDATMALFAPGGTTPLAVGAANPLGPAATNYDLGILDLVVPADGVFKLRISSSQAGEYALAAIVGHAFESEPNDSAAPALIDLTARPGAVGFLDANATDALDPYKVTLAAGERIVLTTQTPMDDTSGVPSNRLNPRLRLLTSQGLVVATDDDSLDGHNARIEAVVNDGGVYFIEAVATSGAGEYVLDVTHDPSLDLAIFLQGAAWTPPFLDQLRLLGLGDGGIELPDDGQPTTPLPWGNVDTVRIEFSRAVEVTRNDLRITGVTVPDYAPTIVSFEYDPIGFVATWRLDRPFPEDRVEVGLVAMSFQPRRFEIVPGDVNRDRAVLHDDFFASLGRQFSRATDSEYDVGTDLDGNGAINILDWQLVLTHLTDEPAAAAAQTVSLFGPAAAMNQRLSSSARRLPIRGPRLPECHQNLGVSKSDRLAGSRLDLKNPSLMGQRRTA